MIIGHVKNMLSRGNFYVSFEWKQNKITEIYLELNSWHQWFIPQYQYEIGYFTTNYPITNDKNNNNIFNRNFKNYLTLIVPNQLTISIATSSLYENFDSNKDNNLCAEIIIRPKDTIPSYIHQSSDIQIDLVINSYPCHIILKKTNN